MKQTPTIGSIGVMLGDTGTPAKLYILDTLYPDGDCDLVLVGEHSRQYVRRSNIAEFWPLLDTLPT